MDKNNDMNGDICFWVTGHSMGGGVANIVAAELLHGVSGINNRTDNVYCYTFAAPNTFYLTDNTYVSPNRAFPDKPFIDSFREPHGIKYRCIFNVVNQDDFVPEVPMKDCGWTKYGRTASISFNSNKKQIENVVRSESKYDLLHYKWTNTNKFINETYKGNTQTIRDIVGSFNSIFEDDPLNMRYSAYTFNDNDYVILHNSQQMIEAPMPKNAKPYQKIDTIGEDIIEYQMPAYFMQYIAFTRRGTIQGIGFFLAGFNKRYLFAKDILINRRSMMESPHLLETYYILTKYVSPNSFN